MYTQGKSPRGIYFEFADRGANETVLFLNGLSVQIVRWPDRMYDDFLPDFNVVRLDNRDVGLSAEGGPYTPEMAEVFRSYLEGPDENYKGYKLNNMVEDTRDVIDSLKIDRLNIVGMSLGGMIAQLFAIKYPSRINKLVLLSTAARFPNDPAASPEAVQAMTAGQGLVEREAIVQSTIDSQVAIGSKGAWEATPDELRPKVEQAFERAHRPEGVLRQFGAIFNTPPWHHMLTGIQAQSLILHGKHDSLFPYQCAVAMFQAMPHAELVLPPLLGHDLNDRNVASITSRIRFFLRG